MAMYTRRKKMTRLIHVSVFEKLDTIEKICDFMVDYSHQFDDDDFARIKLRVEMLKKKK